MILDKKNKIITYDKFRLFLLEILHEEQQHKKV